MAHFVSIAERDQSPEERAIRQAFFSWQERGYKSAWDAIAQLQRERTAAPTISEVRQTFGDVDEDWALERIGFFALIMKGRNFDSCANHQEKETGT